MPISMPFLPTRYFSGGGSSAGFEYGFIGLVDRRKSTGRRFVGSIYSLPESDFQPLRVIADKFNVLQMGMIAAERVFKVMDNQDFLPPAAPDAFSPERMQGSIDFKDVWFAYNEPNYVLKQLNFR